MTYTTTDFDVLSMHNPLLRLINSIIRDLCEMGLMDTENVKKVPSVAWEYWGIVTMMLKYKGLYGLDDKRIECHNRLCEYYGIEKSFRIKKNAI